MIVHCFPVARALGASAHRGVKLGLARAARHARHAAISAPRRVAATRVCVAVGLAALGAAGPAADHAAPPPPIETISRPPFLPIRFDPDWEIGPSSGWSDPPIWFEPPLGFSDPGMPIDPGGPRDPSADPAADPARAPAIAEPSSISLLALATASAALALRARRNLRRQAQSRHSPPSCAATTSS
jgi:hypothetical protein